MSLHVILLCFSILGEQTHEKSQYQCYLLFTNHIYLANIFPDFSRGLNFRKKEILLTDNNRLYLVVKDQNPWNLQNITCIKSNSLEVYYIEHICWCQSWKMLIWIILRKSEVKDFLKNDANVGNILSNLVFQPFKNCKIFLN